MFRYRRNENWSEDIPQNVYGDGESGKRATIGFDFEIIHDRWQCWLESSVGHLSGVHNNNKPLSHILNSWDRRGRKFRVFITYANIFAIAMSRMIVHLRRGAQRIGLLSSWCHGVALLVAISLMVVCFPSPFSNASLPIGLASCKFFCRMLVDAPRVIITVKFGLSRPENPDLLV